MYEVFLEHRAEKDISKIDDALHRRIIKDIAVLKNDPRPAGCRKITGTQNAWRIRVGDYRIIYEIDERGKTVFVMRVRHRREAYR